jgi:hypothetical protein
MKSVLDCIKIIRVCVYMLRGWVFKGQGLSFTAHGPREIEPKPSRQARRPVFWGPGAGVLAPGALARESVARAQRPANQAARPLHCVAVCVIVWACLAIRGALERQEGKREWVPC